MTLPKTQTDQATALFEALTSDQIKKVLATTLDLLGPDQVELLLDTLEPDISLTLKQLLIPNAISQDEAKTISDNKLLADWRELWSEWADVVVEVGDENGAYAQQDAHWEPSYFDPYSLAADLEKIAVKMRPLLEKVFALGQEDDDCFVEEFHAIDDSIGSYPEWMGAGDMESCVFERQTSDCFLTWEWLVAQKHQQSATDFLERVLTLETALSSCWLDDNAYLAFFSETLPPDSQHEIFAYINANKETNRWRQRLATPSNLWNQIYSRYAKKFDADAHLDLCRQNLSQDWQCGPPLIKDMLEKGDLPEVNTLYEQTLASYARNRNRQMDDWQPEITLLTSPVVYGAEKPDPAIIDLLTGWIDIAEKLELEARYLALRFQKLVYATPFAWDDIAEFYRQHQDLSSIEQLARQWGSMMYNRCLPHDIFSKKKEDQDTWVNWLLQAGLKDDPSSFMLKMDVWLEQLQTDPAAFTDQQRVISLLTRDFAALARDHVPYPLLLSILGGQEHKQTALATSRQKWLKDFGGEQFVAPLLDCWREHIVHLVPDPVHHSKSDYTPHARWMAVMQELNPIACHRIINRWRGAHQRRKNLWKALNDAGVIQ